jgi:hypothetical protein
MTPFERNHIAISNINQFGIHLQGECPKTENDVGYIYTVGMTRLGLPELICFGLPHRTMAPYLNKIYHDLVTGAISKLPKRDDDFWTFSTYFDEVEPAMLRRHAEIVFALFANSKVKPTFRQVVWPDRNGAYPFETRCLPEIKARQPYFGTRKRRDADHDQSLGLH